MQHFHSRKNNFVAYSLLKSIKWMDFSHCRVGKEAGFSLWVIYFAAA